MDGTDGSAQCHVEGRGEKDRGEERKYRLKDVGNEFASFVVRQGAPLVADNFNF